MIDADDKIPHNTKFELVIEAQNRHYPLPVPNRISVDKSGTFYFDPVEFTEPGNYTGECLWRLFHLSGLPRK